MINFFRTKEGNARYDAYKREEEFNRGCVLCERTPLREFSLWKIVQNEFPYDRIASIHHLLVPKRHTVENELTEAEQSEFREIKNNALGDYQFLIEPTPKVKSIPDHFHLHLVVSKEIECDTE